MYIFIYYLTFYNGPAMIRIYSNTCYNILDTRNLFFYYPVMTQNTPLLDTGNLDRSYLGTVMLKKKPFMPRVMVSTKRDLILFMTDYELNWLNNTIPDWKFWKDEFRMQAHLYVECHLSEKILMLASLIFMQTEPSHYPLGDELRWIRKNEL